MIPLHFVSDGLRDEAVLPPLVGTLLGREIRPSFQPCARLHGKGSKGLGRKLLFAIRQAHDEKAAGLVAVLDRDRFPTGEKLKELREARTEHRGKNPVFPTVLGEAIPHVEAWLLDDEQAVRRSLRLDGEGTVPNVRDSAYPKKDLEDLIGRCPRSDDETRDLYADIARSLDPNRCRHGQDTGFASFREEVAEELKDFHS